MGHQNLKKKSKFLALVLRHNPSVAHIELDDNGWADVDELIKGSEKANAVLTQEILDEIVETDNKQRYAYNDDKTKIRANQGHSIDVDVELEEKDPPDTLYHGTANRFVDSIMKKGLESRGRKYVHLSMDVSTATTVGRRHGSPAILEIDTKKMSESGLLFYLSKNNVWLTEYVDPKYIVRIK